MVVCAGVYVCIYMRVYNGCVWVSMFVSLQKFPGKGEEVCVSGRDSKFRILGIPVKVLIYSN